MVANQKGFSVAIIIVCVLAVAGIAVLGVYVWKSQSKPVDTKQTASSANTEPEQSTASTNGSLKTYTDDYVSFTYPNDWVVTRTETFTSEYGALSISLKSPADTTIKPLNNSGAGEKLMLDANLIIYKQGRFGDQSCAACGNVTTAQVTSTKSPKLSGNYVTASQPGSSAESLLELLNTTAVVGTDVGMLQKYLININDSYVLRVTGNYTDGSVSFVEISPETKVTQSTSYKQLGDIISSLTIKTSAFPQ